MHSSPAAVFLSQGGQKGKILADAKTRTYRRLRRALAPIHDRCDHLFILYDVEPGGGAFIFWPCSHHAAHRYFLENPAHVDGSFLRTRNFSWDIFCDNPETGGKEFVAHAGDVVLWHSYLTHEGSININDSPRIAFFARWHHHRRCAPAFRYEIPNDLWKYWAILGEICVLSRIAIILEYQSVRIILVGKEFVIILLTPTFTWQQTCLRECKYWMTNSSFILEHSYNNLK